MKLYQLLATLSEKEWPQLFQFFQQECLGAKKIHTAILIEIANYRPSLEQVDSERLLETIAPKQDFKKQYLYDRFREMSQLVEQFLLFKELNQQEELGTQLTLSMYKSRGLAKRFEEKASNIFQEYNQTSMIHWKNTSHCLQSYIQLQNYPEAAYLYLYKHESIPMEASMRCLDDYYMLMKLRLSSNWLAHARYYEQQIEIPLLKDVLAYAKQRCSGNTNITLYHQLTLLNEQWAEDLYQDLKQSFLDEYEHLEESDRLFILLNVVNILHQRMKLGERNRSIDMLQLYKVGVADGLFSEKMPLQEATFLNICNMGSTDPEWTMQFIDQHRHRLNPSTASSAVALGKAMLAFSQKDFQKALSYCDEQVPNSIQYKLRLHSLRLKCLFEIQQEDLSITAVLVKRVMAFQKFLQRNKSLSGAQKAAYRNQARAILKVAYAKQTNWQPPGSKEELKQWIEELSPMAAQAWLLEKVST